MNTKINDKNQALSVGRQENLMKENEVMYRLGVHFGYSKSSSNPKMKPYLFGVRNNIAIFDLGKVLECLEKAEDFLEDLGSKKSKILFVATKPEARDLIEKAGRELGMPYIVERWLGGTLTNFNSIKKRIDYFKDLQSKKASGGFSEYIKKEAMKLEKKLLKMEKYFGGLQTLSEKPSAIIVVDSKKESSAVAEAKKIGIPTVAVMNSDCEPADIEYPVPGNDVATSSIEYFLEKFVDAYKKGLGASPKAGVEKEKKEGDKKEKKGDN
ncbi:30S ribosomal protein S2 [Patescibacteria group bacterium]